MVKITAFLSYGPDGTVPFVTKMQGAWTLVDNFQSANVSKKTVVELCHVRRIEMRRDHAPLPILTAHVTDTSSATDRPVPASQDEFELRLAGDNELLRVPLHEPIKNVLENPDRLNVPSVPEGDIAASRRQKEAISGYRHAVLSSALPVTLAQIDDDTFVESPANAWTQNGELYDPGFDAFKRYWLHCPS
jgi:hypothetical protein